MLQGAQDAHEAIRPSSVFNTPESIAIVSGQGSAQLYTLIWNRFVASQMTAAVFDTMAVKLSQNGVQFAANGSQVKFDGFILPFTMILTRIRCYQIWLLEMWSSRLIANQSNISLNRLLAILKRPLSRPFWKKMGLDVRQPTHRPLKLFRNVTMFALCVKRFEPTELGEIVNKLIVEYFPDIVNVTFTAEMEGKLDDVEVGKSSGNVL